MRIAVTGASGFLGSHLTRQLLAQGYDVKPLIRASRHQKSSTRCVSSTTLTQVDFDSIESLSESLKDCTVVIHLIGVINGSESLLRYANVEMTRNLLAACRKSQIKKILHMSSVAATMGHGPYGQSKAEGERLVRESGIASVIFQPAYIYGSGDRNLTKRMTSVLKYSPIVPVLGGRSFKIQPVHVDDICKAIIETLARDITNDTFVLAGPDQISLKDMLLLMAKAMKVRRLFMSVPLRGVQSLIRLFLKAFPNTRLPLKQVLELDKHQAFDISHARELLHFDPVPFSVGVQTMFGAKSCAV